MGSGMFAGETREEFFARQNGIALKSTLRTLSNSSPLPRDTFFAEEASSHMEQPSQRLVERDDSEQSIFQMPDDAFDTTVLMQQPVLEEQTVVYDLEEIADPAFTCSSADSTDSSHDLVPDPDPDPDPDDLDIGMWTQQKPNSDVKHELDDKITDRALLVEEAVSSPESIEEIPYSAHNTKDDQTLELDDNDNDDGDGDDDDGINNSSHTITVPAETSASSTLHVPPRIAFFEGAQDELEIFPPHLYEQLVAYCRIAKTDTPDFIKTKWPRPDALCFTKLGKRTWFEVPYTQEVLLQARYLYDKNGQITVVKPRPGSPWNGGKAAIVHRHLGTNSVSTTSRNGNVVTQYKWQVWNPLVPQHACGIVWRSVIGGKAPPDKSYSGKTTKSDLNTANPAEAEVSQNGDLSRQLKRKLSTDRIESESKKPRPKTISINPSLLKSDYPVIGSCGARRDLITGEMLMMRKSDGRLVTLRCTMCDENTVSTQQGLLNHLLIVHGTKLPSRDALVELCSIPVNNHSGSGSGSTKKQPMPLPTSYRFLKPMTVTESVQSPTLPTPPTPPVTRRASQRLLATPPPSVAPSEPSQDLVIEPHFVFMKSPEDPKPRIRPLSTINTAEKLFVNALVAGIARKDTLMLTIAVDNKNPRYIFKDDKEDFATILELVRRSKHQNAEIVVTVDNID